MKRVMVRSNQQFAAYVDGQTVDMPPGKIVDMPYSQALDFQRAGLAQIVADSAIKPPVVQPERAPFVPPAVCAVPREGVAAVIVNYNMPERADKLAEYIRAHCQGVEVILVDNGSDLKEPAQHTTLKLSTNVQTTNGWLMGLHYADALAVKRGKNWLAYWFLITSAEFSGEGDPLAPMLDLLQREPAAVGVHPAVEAEVIAWKHLLARGGDQPRRTWMIDNIASLYRAEWFDAIGRFDPDLTFAWGIDLETGYLARKAGRSLYIHEGCTVKKVTDIGYTMQRMNMTAAERRLKAEANMEAVLSAKYSPTWRNMLWNDYRDFAENERVSVIVPTYNRPDLLARALESIKAQTYTNFEALVVNDGGVDVSEIVSRYPFARYFSHASNRGLPAARNTAIQHASGGYIAYLDDDDWYYTKHLETLVRGIKGHRAAYTNAHAIDREDSGSRYVFECEYTPEFILKQNVFPCNTVLHEKSLFEQVGLFDESLPNSEDWDMWIRISQVCGWHHLPVVTCAVDRTRPTMSSDRPAMLKVFEQIRARYANPRPREWLRVREREYAALDIDKSAWEGAHPAGISGCVRVRNDAEFLRPAVISHLPYCDEIVLAVQPSEDDTEAIAAELEREYPGKVRVVRYPLVPVYIHDPAWETTPTDSAYSFIHLSNWALSQCRYSWVMKFEADVIGIATLGPVVERIRKEPTKRVYYGRVVLNVAGPRYRLINAQVPCNGGWDEGIFPNHPDYQFVRAGKYESINHAIGVHECIGWSGLHLKHAKRRYWGKIDEPFVPFTTDNLRAVMDEYLKTHAWPGQDDPHGVPELFEDDWRAYCPPWTVTE
jgi:glycosyltransferase involved in cell wall biosynthesis